MYLLLFCMQHLETSLALAQHCITNNFSLITTYATVSSRYKSNTQVARDFSRSRRLFWKEPSGSLRRYGMILVVNVSNFSVSAVPADDLATLCEFLQLCDEIGSFPSTLEFLYMLSYNSSDQQIDMRITWNRCTSNYCTYHFNHIYMY